MVSSSRKYSTPHKTTEKLLWASLCLLATANGKSVFKPKGDSAYAVNKLFVRELCLAIVEQIDR